MAEIGAKKVVLIPWDPKSEAQRERMYVQRVACGWKTTHVDEWAEKQLRGEKVLYWVVLADDLPTREALLQQHLEQYPEEEIPLEDTSDQVNLVARTPTHEQFIPIGHLAIEKIPEMDAVLGLPDTGVYWIMNVYVSWAIQSGGLGSASMREAEAIAMQLPLKAKTVVLDTVAGEFQKRPESIKAMYTDRGFAVPSVIRTNQEWYERQGYTLFHRIDDGYEWKLPESDETWLVPLVYLKKDLV